MKYKRYSLVVLSLFLILFLFIASASAAGANETDELAADDSTSTVIEKLASDSSSVYNKSDDSNDFRNYGDDLLSADDSANSEIYKHDGSQEVLKADNTWYVDANAASGGDGSQENPFNSLKAVLAGSSAGDVIRIAPGTYSGVNNTGLTIGKILTFEKYGDGEVIFDGQANNNIWTVSANSINIYGLTFINGNATGKGGAIYVTNADFSNSVINATFINNTANSDSFSYGGAVCFNRKVTDLTLNSVFINNAAGLGGAVCFLGTGDNVNVYGEFRNNTAESVGGAIRFERQLKNSNINATFINNKATDGGGGAVQAAYDAENVSVYGEFRNNVAKNGGAIYFAGPNDIIFNIININATFTDNTASRYGGAIYIVNEVSNLAINSTFIHNTATNEGGAVQFLGKVSSSNINSKFINNTAGYGGANYFATLNNVNITGDFINNKATESGNYRGGSANYFNKAVTNVHISGNFISNTIKGSSLTHNEATNYFKETATNVDISGKFINNTGNRLIHIASTSGSNVIHDSIFLNNQVSTIINNIGRVTARNNWFGNNVSNYDKTPSNVGINLASWLFLNATANPGEIILDENSTITFKLQSYNGSNVGDYDASKMNITLDLSQTLGQLDKNASSIGEEITYTVKKDGNAGVTAKYETASYTISLTNLKIPATIDVANSTVDLKVNNETDIGATLTPADAGNLTYLSSNSSVACVENGKIKALAEGSTNITVSYAGNDRYAAVSKIIEVTVTLNDAWVSVNNATLDLVAGETFDIVAVTNPDGLNVTYVADNSGVISVDENGTLTALKGGNATVTVSVGGDGVYALNTTEITVTVRKAPTAITLSNSTFDLKVNEEIGSPATLTPADAGNLTYTSSNSSVVIIESGKIKAVGAGSANITVSFKGNEKYLASENRTIGVNVTLNDASLSVNNVTLDLIIDDTFDLVAVTSPEGLNVTFEADDSGVVSVDENGTVTALKRGKATVIVSVGGDGVYALNTTEVNVTVSRIHPVISATDTIDLKVNDTVDLNATLNYPDDIKLNFASSNENVVRVNDTGMITAVGNGSAYITVSFAGNERYTAAENKIIIVTVSKIPTTIEIFDSHVDMYIDGEHMSDVALVPGDAGDLHYTSSDYNVVYVDQSGFLTAYDVGTAQITVSFPGNDMYEASEGVFSVTVNRHETSIDVVDKLDVKVGDNVNVNATVIPSEAGKPDYASSNESVVKVNRSGEVTAVGAGSTIITVSFKGNNYYADASKDIIVTVSKVDTSIDVADKVEMTVGDVVNLNATLTPGGAGELNYSSSDESVVCVNEIGELTAISGGSAIVTVRFAGNDKYAAAESKNILVTVGKLPAVIDVTGKLEMKVDEVIRLNASLTPEGAGELVYVSSDESVVTVNSLGEVTGITGGAAIVTVKFTGNDEYSAAESKNVLVTVALADASVSAENISMTVDENVTIAATTTPEGLNITYTADDSGVVKVENGVVTGLKEGTAKINLTVGGDNRYLLNSTTITVTVSKVNTSISVVDKLDLIVDDEVNLNATLTPAEAGELEFTSSNESIVAVNRNGEVTAVGEGTANITVRFAGNYKYATAESKNVTVTVSKVNTSISVVDKLDLIVDDEVNLNATLTPAEAGELEYLSSDVSVVSVNSLGEVTAVGNGTANIAVRFVGNYKYAAAESKNVTVTVSKVNTSISVVDELDLIVDDEVNLNATLTPSEAGELEYISSDVSVVGVNSLGEVTAVGNGTANIAVRFVGNYKYAAAESKNVTVIVSKVNTSISVVDELDLIVDDGINLNATLTPAEAGELEYISSDVSVVGVNSLGVVTAVGNGTANITVRFVGNYKYAAAESKNVTVIVSKVNTSISVVDELDLIVDDEVNLNATLTPAEAGELEYLSSDVSVVGVNSLGVVTAVGEGTANITVRFVGNYKYAAAESKNVTVIVSKVNTSISVVDELDLIVDDEVNLNATLTPAEAGELEYLSSDVSVVSVNSLGEVTAVGNGTANITVRFAGNYKYAAAESKNVTVTVRIATNITVERDNIEINVGNTTKIEASLTPAEAGELDYTSSDVSVVTVNGIGEITAVGEGRANITVRFIQNDLYAASSINITVTVALNNASVSAEDISMIIGDNATINVTTSPEGLNVTYTVDDSGVVSLENGVLTALREGTAKINLTVGGDGKYVLNSTEITVTVSKVETSVSIESDNIEINVGDSAEIKASLTPSEAGELEYASSDVNVATVDSLGKVTAVGAGTANITVKFAGNEKYASSSKNIAVSVGRVASKFADVVVVANKVTLVLTDAFGNPISGANISYTINGISASAVSDANGSFEIISQGGAVIVVEYLGSDIYTPSNITITMAPQRQSTVIVGEDFTQYACDYYVGERGNNFTVQLRDANGRPIADKTVYIGYNGVTLVRTTDAKGYANVQINLKNSGLYTFVVVFMDDDSYDASMKVFKVTINKKPTSISASAKTFKASAKTKKYTVTLKTIPGSSVDGKTYLASGKKVSLKINGKTYTAKTNAKGQATFSLKITKRGIFNAVVSYAGDNTYNPSSSKVKITIK